MDPEERAIYLLLVFAGGLPVVGAAVNGGRVGAGITLSIVLLVVGVIGLASPLWRRRLPAAAVRRRSR